MRLPAVAEALLDPERADRTFAILLGAFVAAWTVYGVVAQSATDVHVDVGELLIWAQEPELRWKHPPLASWVVRMWFAILPFNEWTAQLLASVTSGAALWCSWKVAGEWLDPTKRAAAVLLLSLVPLYTFHALVFNANTAQTPLWAAASWLTLRWLRSGGADSALLVGVSTAGALLTKLWAGFLVIGIGLTWLLLPGRVRRLRQPAVWIAAGAFTLAMLPYALWLMAYPDRPGMIIADLARPPSVMRTVTYLAGAFAYVVVPLTVFLALRPTRAVWLDTLWPTSPWRRLPVLLLVAPLVLPAIANLVVPSRLVSLWTIPNWTLLPVVLLGSTRLVVRPVDVRRLLTGSAALTLGALMLSPVVALVQHQTQDAGAAAHFRQLSVQVRYACAETTMTGSPRLVGQPSFVAGVVPYLSGWRAFGGGNGGAAAAQRDTIAIGCASDDAQCRAMAEVVLSGRQSTVREVRLTRRVLNYESVPRAYTVWCAPPKPESPAFRN